jgi:hypothetical protein
MKKQLTVALGLAVLATPAFASKARLQALGEDVNGSFYVNDLRNVFLNAANVNNYKDTVTFEWGDTTSAAAAGQDSSATPKAEGGFFKSAGNINYGVYLGSESNTSNGYRFASGVDMTEAQESNNIDVFVGGDAGMKWGANVTYSKTAKDEADGDATQNALRTRLGVISGDVEAFANLSLANKAEDSNGDEFKGKLGLQLGAIYNLNNYRLFAEYRSLAGEAEGTVEGDIKSSQLQVGAGHTSKLNDKASLFTKVQYQMNNAENDNGVAFGATCNLASSIGCEEYKANFIPVVVGLEYDATSWLALRGSVSQTIWGSQEDADDKKGFAETTVVNAGASLKFGDLAVDGVIGNGAAGLGSDTTDGQFNTDILMSRVSMTYRF